MNQEDTLVLTGIAGAGVFFLFTGTGKEMFEDLTDIDLDDILPFDFELEEFLGLGGVEGKDRRRRNRNRRERREDPKLYEDPNYHFPIQDLYVPPNYWTETYREDPYRKPSKEFADWYYKGSAAYLEDYVYPEHHYWNPDYYYFFGNLYKRWYPNIYDIKDPPKRTPYWFGEVYG